MKSFILAMAFVLVGAQAGILARGAEDPKTAAQFAKQVEELAIQKKEKDADVSKLQSQEKDLAKQIAAKKKRYLDLKR